MSVAPQPISQYTLNELTDIKPRLVQELERCQQSIVQIERSMNHVDEETSELDAFMSTPMERAAGYFNLSQNILIKGNRCVTDRFLVSLGESYYIEKTPKSYRSYLRRAHFRLSQSLKKLKDDEIRTSKNLISVTNLIMSKQNAA